MKIRNGFVSNSSSSSFIVAVTKPMASVYDVKNEFYYKNKKVVLTTDKVYQEENARGVSYDYGDTKISLGDASAMIAGQLQRQKPMTKKQVIEEVSCGYFDGIPEWHYDTPANKFRNEYRQKFGHDIMDDAADKVQQKKYWDMQEKEWADNKKATKAAAKKVVDAFMKENKGKKFFVLTFSDNDGEISGIMEHGDALRNVPHITVSYH
jgi:hypothetical protein